MFNTRFGDLFEWDENKNIENIKKHGVSFDEAVEAFLDKKRVIIEDYKHSSIEKRFFCIGKYQDDILTVRYTVRESRIRIIGAGFWRKERGIYEKKSSLY